MAMSNSLLSAEEMGPGSRVPAAGETEWERIWIQALRTPWTSLAVVPCDASSNAERVARELVEVGALHEGSHVQYLDARGASLTGVQTFATQITSLTRHGQRVIVAVDPVIENPAAIPIVAATSAALLVARARESRLASARSVVEALGHTRLIGGVLIE